MNKIILFLIILLIDWYAFRSFRFVASKHHFSSNVKNIITILYASLSVLNWVGVVYFAYFRHAVGQNADWFNMLLAIAFGFFIAKVIGGVIILLDDVKVLFTFLVKKIWLSFANNSANKEGDIAISRSIFLQWLSVGLTTLIFSTWLLGIRNRYNYQVHRQKLAFPRLPDAFHGLRIVHISDIHSGSLKNIAGVEKGIEMINALNPDMIFFTGDLVNNQHEEVLPLLNTFSKLKAPLGVFSILGNHDYGDYVTWQSKEHKQNNLAILKNHHKEMGWKLLLNDSAVIEKGGQKIGVLGVENWSNFGRFPKYGDLKKTVATCPDCDFKILLSHDPTHWRAEVLDKHPDIAITLSGHTHGAQYGIEIPAWKWSPVQYFYKEWAGLYQQAGQFLYVNRGFGFLGYPGRFGILPEITFIELEKKA